MSRYGTLTDEQFAAEVHARRHPYTISEALGMGREALIARLVEDDGFTEVETMSRRERRQMKREIQAADQRNAEAEPAANSADPQHSYGLRHEGEGLYVVVRVEGAREQVLTRPEYRAYALGALVDRIEEDPWGA